MVTSSNSNRAVMAFNRGTAFVFITLVLVSTVGAVFLRTSSKASNTIDVEAMFPSLHDLDLIEHDAEVDSAESSTTDKVDEDISGLTSDLSKIKAEKIDDMKKVHDMMKEIEKLDEHIKHINSIISHLHDEEHAVSENEVNVQNGTLAHESIDSKSLMSKAKEETETLERMLRNHLKSKAASEDETTQVEKPKASVETAPAQEPAKAEKTAEAHDSTTEGSAEPVLEGIVTDAELKRPKETKEHTEESRDESEQAIGHNLETEAKLDAESFKSGLDSVGTQTKIEIKEGESPAKVESEEKHQVKKLVKLLKQNIEKAEEEAAARADKKEGANSNLRQIVREEVEKQLSDSEHGAPADEKAEIQDEIKNLDHGDKPQDHEETASKEPAQVEPTKQESEPMAEDQKTTEPVSQEVVVEAKATTTEEPQDEPEKMEPVESHKDETEGKDALVTPEEKKETEEVPAEKTDETEKKKEEAEKKIEEAEKKKEEAEKKTKEAEKKTEEAEKKKGEAEKKTEEAEKKEEAAEKKEAEAEQKTEEAEKKAEEAEKKEAEVKEEADASKENPEAPVEAEAEKKEEEKAETPEPEEEKDAEPEKAAAENKAEEEQKEEPEKDEGADHSEAEHKPEEEKNAEPTDGEKNTESTVENAAAPANGTDTNAAENIGEKVKEEEQQAEKTEEEMKKVLDEAKNANNGTAVAEATPNGETPPEGDEPGAEDGSEVPNENGTAEDETSTDMMEYPYGESLNEGSNDEELPEEERQFW